MIYSKPTRTTTSQISKILVTSLLIAITTIAATLAYQLLTSSPSTIASSTDGPPQQGVSEAASPTDGPPQQGVSEAASPTDGLQSEVLEIQQPPQQEVGEVALPTDNPHSEATQPQQQPRRAVDEATPATHTLPNEPPQLQQPPRQEVGEATSPIDIPRGEQRDALGEADGVVEDGTTVFDDETPGVANLDPALLDALREATTDAANNGVSIYVTSGWRSPEYQNQLLREAVSTYGSEAHAARWVATTNTSPHVSGDAVDIGSNDAIAWLSEHGTKYGLCQIYRNEPWHYELRPKAIDQGCPPMYADPTRDPRMQQ